MLLRHRNSLLTLKPNSTLRSPYHSTLKPSQGLVSLPRAGIKIANTKAEIETELGDFAVRTLKLDKLQVEQSIDRDGNSFRTTHPTPKSTPFTTPVFDFSNEALIQSGMRSVYYLMFGSFYGAYYYAMVQPHSMYLMACSGLSLFMTVGFFNHQMNMVLSVADMQLRQDGENVRVITYNGQSYDVPIAKICWLNSSKEKVVVNTVDKDSRVRRFVLDFSKTRPQHLVDPELCFAIMHPDVHKIVFSQ